MKKLMSNNDYHAHTAIGSTLLKKIASKTLAHAITDEFKQTDAMILGSAVHCAILEPENFDKEFIVSQKFDRRTNAGKAAYAEFVIRAGGKTIIDEEQNEIVNGIKAALARHEIANAMLSGGESEYSYFAKVGDVECKCRPDYFNKNALIDLKTCRDASDDGFTKACIDLKYHIQAAFYLDVYNAAMGTDLNEFYFVAVETTAPFAVNVFKMGEIEIGIGREQYKKALAQYMVYQQDVSKLEDFAYPKQINKIQFPVWALEKLSA